MGTTNGSSLAAPVCLYHGAGTCESASPSERIHKNIKLIFKCVQKTQALRRRTKQQKINALFLLTSIVWWQENFKHISVLNYRVIQGTNYILYICSRREEKYKIVKNLYDSNISIIPVSRVKDHT